MSTQLHHHPTACRKKGPVGASHSLSLSWSDGFPEWLTAQGMSLAVSTYQANRLLLIGCKPNGRLSLFERRFERPLGLHVDAAGRLFMATCDRVWRLDNVLAPNERHGDFDRLYVPKRSWVTGHLNTHDLALGADGRLLFVNTLFSCLARPDRTHSFEAVWAPPFITALLPEDRCHLNGMAVEGGIPRYVTMRSRTDGPHAWRGDPATHGCLMDASTGEALLTDLCVPHSPRLYRNRLWLLNSGTGELGAVDRKGRRFVPVHSFPGYLRGLAFHGGVAVTGTSRARDGFDFSGLPLHDTLQRQGTPAICGLFFIDLATGSLLHHLQFHGTVSELYDVQVLEGARCPMALGLQSDEIAYRVTLPPTGDGPTPKGAA